MYINICICKTLFIDNVVILNVDLSVSVSDRRWILTEPVEELHCEMEVDILQRIGLPVQVSCAMNNAVRNVGLSWRRYIFIYFDFFMKEIF